MEAPAKKKKIQRVPLISSPLSNIIKFALNIKTSITFAHHAPRLAPDSYCIVVHLLGTRSESQSHTYQHYPCSQTLPSK